MSVFATTQNITLLYSETGQVDKAIEMLGGVYSSAIQKGQNDTVTLNIGHILSVYLYGKEKYEEAFEVATDIFSRRMEIPGPDHVDTLKTANHFGELLRSTGKYGEGLLLQQNVHSKFAKKFGTDHELTFTAKIGIAFIWSDIGMKEEAISSLREILGSASPNKLILDMQLEMAKVLKK